jgi:Tol biopolymer transport system component
MKFRTLILMLTVAAMLSAQSGGDADVMLQRAIRKESVEGDLKGAIELYKKIVAGAAKSRATAAKALLRLGECYEKQGNAEAQHAYERLVREFGDQKEQAHNAEVRLSAMGGSTNESKPISAQLIGKGAGRLLSGRVTPDGRLYPFIDPESGDVAVRDLRTGAVRRLTNEGTMGKPNGAHGESPIPSRDGRQIVYGWYSASRPDELRIINIDGSGMRTVVVKTKLGWLNLWDWSPDGKSVAVDAGGGGLSWSGIATIDLETGEVHQTGRSAGWGDFEVAGFSPDGRFLVYSREVRLQAQPDRDIYAMEMKTGRETVVVSGAGRDRRPAWVPDTDEIVFMSNRSGRNGIWMVRFKEGQAASEPVLVRDNVGDFSPNGISRDGSFYYTLRYQSRDIYRTVVEPQTLHPRQSPVRVLETYVGHNWAPSWAPSGDSFAYYSERDTTGASRLVIRDSDGVEAVVKEAMRADQLWLTEYPAHWCGSDRVLSLGLGGPRKLIFDARTAARQKDQLDVGPALGQNDSWNNVGFSHDCQLSYISTGRPRAIHKLDLATGAKLTILTDAGDWANDPRVSPDGRWLALYGKLEGGSRAGILVLSTAAGPLRMLDQDGLSRNYAWSPDSKRLLTIHKASGEENELYYTEVDGGNPQPTGIRMPGLAHPSLNTDGTKLLFGSATTVNEFWVLRNLPLGVSAKSR